MATQTSLAIRQREAYERIGRAVNKLAKGKGTDLLALRHRDPGIEQTLRVEAIAADIEALIKAKADDTQELPPVTVETVKAEPLKTVETVEVKPAPVPRGKRR